jgi:hypothetical protein
LVDVAAQDLEKRAVEPALRECLVIGERAL